MMATERDKLFDVSKGIAILLVVVGHIITAQGIVFFSISACHMPLFFFVSGFFFEKSITKYEEKTVIIKKTKTLLIPFISWSIIAFIINSFFLDDRLGIFEQAKEIFLHARSVWFLLALYFANVLFIIIGLVCKKIKISFNKCSIVTSVLLIFCNSISFFAIYKLEWLAIYFAIGICMAQNEYFNNTILRIKTRNEYLQGIVSASLLIVYVVLVNILINLKLFEEFYVRFDLNSSHILYYLGYYVLGCLGILLIIEISSLILKTNYLERWFSKLGKYSLDIYVMHMFFVKAVDLLHLDKTKYFYEIIYVAISVAICGIITLVADKVLNRITLYKFIMGRDIK